MCVLRPDFTKLKILKWFYGKNKLLPINHKKYPYFAGKGGEGHCYKLNTRLILTLKSNKLSLSKLIISINLTSQAKIG